MQSPLECLWNAKPHLFACVVSVKGPRNFVFGVWIVYNVFSFYSHLLTICRNDGNQKMEKCKCIWVLRKLPVATSSLATVYKAGDYGNNKEKCY